jgi:hypothetical protein
MQRWATLPGPPSSSLLADFWTLPDCPDFNLQDFSICSVLKGKVQSMPYTDLADLSIAAEWDWLEAEYIRKTCRRSYCCRLKTVPKKN